MSDPAETEILIRDLETVADMRDVEQIQKDVWGVPDLDVVPLSQLLAAKASGGVLIGAFDNRTLAGFVYGFVGYERGTTVHHSHMLAVKPEYRAHDLGFRLKTAQREIALEQGIEIMTWTFDPLQSLNAYFNFNKLGIVADQYFVNFYGEDAASFLHRNGTDRLWVSWHLASERVARKLDKAYSAGSISGLPAIIEVGEGDTPHTNDLAACLSGERAIIEIPADINLLERQNSELAFEWRTATRSAFTEAIAAGFVVDDFYRTGPADRRIGSYVLRREKSP
jgi:predicted GNAT superfamily acetyltransferase